MPTFTEKFLQTPHHPTIKDLIKNDGQLGRPVASLLNGNTHLAVPALHGIFNIAVQAGKDWAWRFLPHVRRKEARSIDVSGIVERVIREIGDRATKLFLGDRGKDIKRSTLVDNGRHVVRLNVIDSYMLSALQEWRKVGIVGCKRIELDDMKTCPVCRYLNGKEYIIEDLLDIDNPLTHDTHKNCRGAFVPIVNSISKLVEGFNKDKQTTFDMNQENAVVRAAPIEYQPWFEQFFRRVKAPFSIIFDPKFSADYELGRTELRINPSALFDEDPREIISSAMAQKVPKSLREKVSKDYRTMLELGVVNPPMDTNNDGDLFDELYVQYLLNQLDDPYEVIYFKMTFDGTKYGKQK